MCRVDRKLSLDAESRSTGEMMRGESQTGLNFKFEVELVRLCRTCEITRAEYGRAPVIRMRSFKANGVERETH